MATTAQSSTSSSPKFSSVTKRKGLWIPGPIWSLQIPTSDRVLLADVLSYTMQGRTCFASNEYFAELLGISVSGARKVVARLKARGLLSTQIEMAEGAPRRTLTPGIGCPSVASRVTLEGQGGGTTGTHTNTRTSTNTKTREGTSAKSKPKNLDEVLDAFTEFGAADEAERFWNYYEANGWVQGRGKSIKNWKAAARNWMKNAGKYDQKKPRGFKPDNFDTGRLSDWVRDG